MVAYKSGAYVMSWMLGLRSVMILATLFEVVDLFGGFEVRQAAADGRLGGVEYGDVVALPEAAVVRAEKHDDSIS